MITFFAGMMTGVLLIIGTAFIAAADDNLDEGDENY